MIEKIENAIAYYDAIHESELNKRIVIKPEAFDSVKAELEADELETICGLPYEVYEKISTDFYITEIIE